MANPRPAVRAPSATKYLDDLRATLALLKALADDVIVADALRDRAGETVSLNVGRGLTLDQMDPLTSRKWKDHARLFVAALLARAGGGG